jgi:phage tail-like protein
MATNYPPVGYFFRVDFQLENGFSQTLPVRAKYTDLVLKRGLIVNSAVVKWCKDAIENLDIQPITIVVILLNEKQNPLLTYNFTNAWPKKWSVSDFNAQESKIVVETMELSYQYFRAIF